MQLPIRAAVLRQGSASCDRAAQGGTGVLQILQSVYTHTTSIARYGGCKGCKGCKG